MFSFVPIACCHFTRYCWEEPNSLFFTTLMGYLFTWITSFLNLLFSRLNSPNFLSLFSAFPYRRDAPVLHCGALLDSPVFLCLFSTSELRIPYSRYDLTSAEMRCRITCFNLLAHSSPRHYLASFNLVFTRTPMFCSAKLFLSLSAASMYWCIYVMDVCLNYKLCNISVLWEHILFFMTSLNQKLDAFSLLRKRSSFPTCSFTNN